MEGPSRTRADAQAVASQRQLFTQQRGGGGSTIHLCGWTACGRTCPGKRRDGRKTGVVARGVDVEGIVRERWRRWQHDGRHIRCAWRGHRLIQGGGVGPGEGCERGPR